MAEKLKIIPLGGLGEIGKNMMVIEYGNDMIVIDAGLMFPEEEMLGIDLVLPDFTYVEENQEKLRGIFLTHGHEDHTGALPFMINRLRESPPIYGTKLTLGLAKGRIAEFKLLDRAILREIDEASKISVGEMELEFLPVCHSVPDGVAIAIKTPLGTVLHLGDFKFDFAPIDGRKTDFGRIALLGQKGVLLMLADSTNAEVPGITPPEKEVGRALDRIFKYAKGRIIVACFASHIHRAQQVLNVAFENYRKVAVIGRSMEENVKIASDLGYLTFPPDTLISRKKIDDYRPSEIVVLCTGSQGEPMSALTRIASGDHKFVNIVKGDTVIVAATPVPGNEQSVARTINLLFKNGASVFYEGIVKAAIAGPGVHVSGHAAREELKLLHSLVKPKYFIPIHGEDRHLKRHADIAKDLGIDPNNIFIAHNGDVITFDERGASLTGNVEAGLFLVDGLGVGDIKDVVLRDRQHLSTDGIFIVVAGVSMQDKKIISDPDIISRGFVYAQEDEIVEESKIKVLQALDELLHEGITDVTLLQDHVKKTLSSYLYAKTKRRPIVMTVIMEV